MTFSDRAAIRTGRSRGSITIAVRTRRNRVSVSEYVKAWRSMDMIMRSSRAEMTQVREGKSRVPVLIEDRVGRSRRLGSLRAGGVCVRLYVMSESTNVVARGM